MKQSNKKGAKNRIGALGEEVCANYLKRKGFLILDRNYLKKWGEIDIVARGTDGRTHFIEVKTVSYETKQELEWSVTHGTWRPEENVHRFKLRKLERIIESWIMESNYDGDWQIDVAGVRIVEKDKYATIKLIENVA